MNTIFIPEDKSKGKTYIRGLWLDKGKIYYDYIKEYNYKGYISKDILSGICKHYKQLALFYITKQTGCIYTLSTNKKEALEYKKIFKHTGKKGLKDLLKKLLKQYRGLTIYTKLYEGILLKNTYIIEVYYNFKTTKKRKTKRRKLLNTLINDTINKLNLHNIDIKIIDKNENSKGSSWSQSNNALSRHKIAIDLINLDKTVKRGYRNDYYSGRAERLSFVKNNKKLALYFVILHELAHILLRFNNNNKEYHADSFAIINLKKQGFNVNYATSKGLRQCV